MVRAGPAAALTLGWMTPDEPELRTLAAAPGVLRATVSRSVAQALRLRAQERPLAVILDDAHHADDATLEALEYATVAEAEVPLWICVAARPSRSTSSAVRSSPTTPRTPSVPKYRLDTAAQTTAAPPCPEAFSRSARSSGRRRSRPPCGRASSPGGPS